MEEMEEGARGEKQIRAIYRHYYYPLQTFHNQEIACALKCCTKLVKTWARDVMELLDVNKKLSEKLIPSQNLWDKPCYSLG